MSGLHRENPFEAEICETLGSQGWLYTEGAARGYDRNLGLYLPDLLAWFQETQPDSWASLEKSFGNNAALRVGERLRKLLDERGTLEVLRRGLDLVGLKKPLMLVQFKPALGMNDVLQKQYAANRLRVIRQVTHSPNNPGDELDLVLFVNGIPVATAELKSDFTQDVQEAVEQYRRDRHPLPKGGKPEPILSFPGGALVHFAVSQSEVQMTTRLEGAKTRFLPFNRGSDGGAGNAPNPNGYATSYLWQEVWQRDSWLQILGRYLVGKRDDKKQLVGWIFPRYHQLDATRKLVADVLEKGPGQKYLIQHSAGSGKTNSIAWTAHFLADLHDAQDNKLFDSVLVVSDRTVLDSQLQEAIFDAERTTGVVAALTREHGSKSAQLKEALEAGKKIIVCTIQTFPAAMAAAQDMAATEGKRFAVIADEAHSSQTGEASAKLKQLLSAEELAELKDGGEIDTEALLAVHMDARTGGGKGLTYVAFTATPKGKTLELFGAKGDDGLPRPFHLYSMRQAIEEEFILDVLKNYTPYSLAFKLANDGKEIADKSVDRSEAVKRLMQWVRLHPHNIASKVQIVVEHYRENVQPLLDGKAKAMIVVASRLEAVRWQKAIRAYIERQKYPLGVLVAFSGEVDDPDSFPQPVSESSAELNPSLKGKDIREAFKSPAYHLLLVANKFQTGFDQPLLCGIYVDKRLSDIQAVQTLSRLNRAYEANGVKKDTTYILDFVNDPADILASFKKYYETAEIEANTDPHLVLDLRAKLDAAGYYDDFEVQTVARVVVNPDSRSSELSKAIAPVADRILKRYGEAKKLLSDSADETLTAAAKDRMEQIVLFKGDMEAFVRLYAFLSQIFDYGDTDIEKRFLFYKHLLPLLDFRRNRDEIDLGQVVLTHHTLKRGANQRLGLSTGEAEKLQPMTAVGTGQPQDKQKALLSEIIRKVNDLFDGQLTEDDKLQFVNALKAKMLENTALQQQANSNAEQQFHNSPDLRPAMLDAIIDAGDAQQAMSTQAINSERLREALLDILLGPGQLYEALRARGVSPAAPL